MAWHDGCSWGETWKEKIAISRALPRDIGEELLDLSCFRALSALAATAQTRSLARMRDFNG